MPALHLHKVSFSYSSAVPILSNVSLSIGEGWTGVVGTNGAGKTTLLELIGGDLTTTVGRIAVDPSDGIVVHCPQTAGRKTESDKWRSWSLVDTVPGGAQTLADRRSTLSRARCPPA